MRACAPRGQYLVSDRTCVSGSSGSPENQEDVRKNSFGCSKKALGSLPHPHVFAHVFRSDDIFAYGTRVPSAVFLRFPSGNLVCLPMVTLS